MIVFAPSIEEIKKNIFLLFIENHINGNNNYDPIINHVLREAKEYQNREKDIYNIDRNYFNIIVNLSKYGNDFISGLNIDCIEPSDYLNLKNIIEKPEFSGFFFRENP